MEWGVNTAELENLRRLTPDVFRSKPEHPWHISVTGNLLSGDASPRDAKYCLNRAISILLRKQEHQRSRRWGADTTKFILPSGYEGDAVYQKADRKSEVVHNVISDYSYTVLERVNGFDADENYFRILRVPSEKAKGAKPLGALDNPVFGYVLVKE